MTHPVAARLRATDAGRAMPNLWDGQAQGDTPPPGVLDRSVMRVPNPAEHKPRFFESQLVEEKHAYTCGFTGTGQGALEENHR